MKISENHEKIWKTSNFFSVSNFENAKKNRWKFAEILRSERCKACKSCRSRQELSNEYFLAKIGFDTADKITSPIIPRPEKVNFHIHTTPPQFRRACVRVRARKIAVRA
jgi:hypothetical protein